MIMKVKDKHKKENREIVIFDVLERSSHGENKKNAKDGF